MPVSSARARDQRCIHPSLVQGRSVSLPVLADSGHNAANVIRPSRSGKRRAIVLASVQGLMIAHVVLWLLSRKYGWLGGGQTTTPVEPSESMEFVKHGVINAGLIFFAIALLSTLILGRWFCGWGCHIVMLQDFCGWMMKKIGVRPKAFRSRLLLYVPLLLALYMFVWPAAYRWGVNLADWLIWSQPWGPPTRVLFAQIVGLDPFPGRIAPWGVSEHLTTTEFWKTFPGVMIAIPFLLVCGFATVYFLGAKGFCTYGCPYGGFFAPLDKFAVGKIRVTDACEGCGHCTAVCTSNVRVHEEVREYGMVVDPGCMKCMDCVSVCPNEALYFGFGKPTVAKGPAKNEAPHRKFDLSWREEIFCAAVFALTFFCTRGPLPMLMAAGLAGCVTFITWKAWRLWRDPNVTLHRFQLKLRGRLQRSGFVLAGGVMVTLLLVLHSGLMQTANGVAGWQDDQVTVSSEEVFTRNFAAVTPGMRQHASKALRWYRLGSFITSGGAALTTIGQSGIDIRRAWLYCVLDQFDEAERLLRQAFARDESEQTAAVLAKFLRDRNDPAKAEEAMAMYERLLPLHPEYTFMVAEYEAWAYSEGRIDQILAVHRARLERDPRNVLSLRSMSILLLQGGNLDEGLLYNRRWIERDERSSEAHRWRAMALADLRQMDQAIAEMQLAVKHAPHDVHSRALLADMLEAVGRKAEAAEIRSYVNR